MADYRLYFNDVHGHIARVVEMKCDNDAEAIAQAAEISNGQPVELWQLGRCVIANDEASMEYDRSEPSGRPGPDAR